MSQPARILVVDDETNVRLVFRMALESAGDRVAKAGDGHSALASLPAGGADLAFRSANARNGRDGDAPMTAGLGG